MTPEFRHKITKALTSNLQSMIDATLRIAILDHEKSTGATEFTEDVAGYQSVASKALEQARNGLLACITEIIGQLDRAPTPAEPPKKRTFTVDTRYETNSGGEGVKRHTVQADDHEQALLLGANLTRNMRGILKIHGGDATEVLP